MPDRQKGFTLIELLVVIAIVAVLAGALLIAINPQSMIQKGRDSKRLQDVDTLVDAINLAIVDGEILLADTSACGNCTSTGSTALDGTGYVMFTVPVGKTGLSKFIPNLPSDPLNTAPNVYTYASDGSNFEVNSTLEHADNAGKMTTDGGNSNTAYEKGTALNLIN